MKNYRNYITESNDYLSESKKYIGMDFEIGKEYGIEIGDDIKEKSSLCRRCI